MAGRTWLPLATGIGIVTFVAANILALAQTNDRRLLGYSSVAQIGLILTVIGQRDVLGEHHYYIAGGILLAHAVAKAGLFWLSGMVAERELMDWTVLRKNPLLIFAFATFIAMLIGLPPFPGFYAKWELAHIAHRCEGRFFLVLIILLSALVEAGYLFRWFGYVIKRPRPEGRVSWTGARGWCGRSPPPQCLAGSSAFCGASIRALATCWPFDPALAFALALCAARRAARHGSRTPSPSPAWSVSISR